MKIISIVGPTASGKTKIAIGLAKKYNGEIINTDSRIIYKDFSIGTDKPKKDKYARAYLVNGINHHLIDFLEPTETFSIAKFNILVKRKIKEIEERSKLPILVGGSSLYLDSFLYNYSLSSVKINLKLRRELEKKSINELLVELKKLSRKSYSIVDKKNKRRVVRALELAYSGLTVERQDKKLANNILLLGVKKDKQELYRLIDKRVDSMIKNGFISEVRRLMKKYPLKSPAFSSIGYKPVVSFLGKEISLDDAIFRIKVDTHHLAKRQLTWYKRDENIRWVKDVVQASTLVKVFLRD